MKTYITATKTMMATLAAASMFGAAVDVAGQTAPGNESTPPPPPQVQTEPTTGDAALFYAALKPHGTWMEVAPFGLVWQPKLVAKNKAWRPYLDGGKWVWLNDTWCWQSEYEWGWAPFHYGRWMQNATLGWVWIPGSEWSAGWVTWRKTDTHYHWAPRPLERSLYVKLGASSGGGLEWGFCFSLGEQHYVSAPRSHFGERIPVAPVHVSREAQIIFGNNLPAAVETPQQSTVVVMAEPAPVVTVPVYRPLPLYRPICESPYTYSHHDSRDRHDPPRRPAVTHSPPRHDPPPATPSRNVKSGSQSRDREESKPADRRTSKLMDIMTRSRK